MTQIDERRRDDSRKDQEILESLFGEPTADPAIGSAESLASASLISASNPIPGIQWLGHGYDVFNGAYLNSGSVRGEPLFDWGKTTSITFNERTYSLPETIYYSPLSDFDSEFYSAKRSNEYQQSLSAKLSLGGEYEFFKGSLDADFSKALETQHEVQVVTLIEKTRYWQLQAPDPEELQRMLLVSARRHINEMSPYALYDRYGTHYLWNVQVGGSFIQNSLTTKSVFKSESEFKIAAQATVEILKGEASAKQKEAAKTFAEVSEIRTRLEGGATHLGFTIRKDGIEGWAKTIPDNPAFAGFTKESFRPIWELAESKSRRDALREAYEFYAARMDKYRGDAARRLLLDVRMFWQKDEGDPQRPFSAMRYTAGSRPPGWFGGDVHFRAFARAAPEAVPVYLQTNREGTHCRLSVSGHSGDEWASKQPEFYAFPEPLPGTVAIHERQLGGFYLYFDAKTDAIRFGSQPASIVFYALAK
jgi:MAC/Perforin domain